MSMFAFALIFAVVSDFISMSAVLSILIILAAPHHISYRILQPWELPHYNWGSFLCQHQRGEVSRISGTDRFQRSFEHRSAYKTSLQ